MDDERYGRLSSLRPTFVNYVKNMLDTDRRLAVRPISENLDISTFTAHFIIKKTCLRDN